jgi:hypothetical protein
MKNVLTFMLVLLLSLTLVSAVNINSVEVNDLNPGGESSLKIELENNLDYDVKDLSLNLEFSGTKFSPVGASEDSLDKLNEDDEDSLSFRIRADNDIVPGNYELPYTLKYEVNNDKITRSGTIGIRVIGNADLDFTLNVENAVIDNKGKILLKIVNKGYSDAKFVNVKLVSSDFVLLSEQDVYVGTVDSDDFDIAEFEVLFDKLPARFKAIVEYKDFDNVDRVANVDLPLTIYSKEEAVKLGIIEKSNLGFFFVILVLVVIIFLIRRIIKKRRKNFL